MNRLSEQPVNRMATEPSFEIKKLKGMDGRDGPAYSCELWINGKLACAVVNSGNGGCTDFYWHDPSAEKILNDYVAALPLDMPNSTWPDWMTRTYPNGYAKDVDCFIAELCDAKETEAKIRKVCKRKTAYALKSDPETLFTIDVPYSPVVSAKLKTQHGDNLQEIFNENPKYASSERN